MVRALGARGGGRGAAVRRGGCCFEGPGGPGPGSTVVGAKTEESNPTPSHVCFELPRPYWHMPHHALVLKLPMGLTTWSADTNSFAPAGKARKGTKGGEVEVAPPTANFGMANEAAASPPSPQLPWVPQSPHFSTYNVYRVEDGAKVPPDVSSHRRGEHRGVPKRHPARTTCRWCKLSLACPTSQHCRGPAWALADRQLQVTGGGSVNGKPSRLLFVAYRLAQAC